MHIWNKFSLRTTLSFINALCIQFTISIKNHFCWFSFSSIVSYCVRYTTYIACNVLGVCVSLYKILFMVVCVCVCSRFACSLLLLLSIYNISTIKYYSIFVLLQHFLKKNFALCSIFLYSILIPYILCVSVCVCVNFTCAMECVPFIISISFPTPTPSGIDFS